MPNLKSGSTIRQEFIEYFKNKGHTFVPSSSLVPGGDQTLLFTNAGMVQFKDVFLGVDKRDYSRAVNSQKCMRVAGKHNDLDDVGRDDLHHTFFEMLGNWSFGDYYKDKAISWAWDLLTNIWGLDPSRLWVTCFKDEKGEIETDQEAADNWKLQKGLPKDHILFFGRKDNFWEMADTGPCGPCSEIHYDKGEAYCDKKGDPAHQCGVNGDCHRYLELWNLVFIQYNRTSPKSLDPLPSKHVDTGMGFERIVSVLQGVDSNYRTDLLLPLIEVVMTLTGDDQEKRNNNFTPYRVIADHARSASFLIADGVVPGNIGRNYICRMIIRRASRFGSQLGLKEPFLAKVAEKVIKIYGDAYPELKKNEKTILNNLTLEETRFQSTVERGLAFLDEEINCLLQKNQKILDGKTAFDLYATHGLPLEITRDVLKEKGLEADQVGFFEAMEVHRANSGAGKEFGPLGGEDAEFYNQILKQLLEKDLIDNSGINYDPYEMVPGVTKIIDIIQNGQERTEIKKGERGEVIIKATGFYIESGGQVSDTGEILQLDGDGIFKVESVRKPAPGVIVHYGEVVQGKISIGMEVRAEVDSRRRQDIMRNHTATHLLHAQLREILGDHVRQAGSLVAPDHLRFDFTHSRPMTKIEIKIVEDAINSRILDNFSLLIQKKELKQALQEGATALFGEKYGEHVRTISIGDNTPFSYELCGGTHVNETSEIGLFKIINEGSAAAGIRRIEAVTGRKAYELISDRQNKLDEIKNLFDVPESELVSTVKKVIYDKEELEKELTHLLEKEAIVNYEVSKDSTRMIDGKLVLWLVLENSSLNVMRQLSDRFRKDFNSGIGLFLNIDAKKTIQLIVTVTKDLVEKKVHAGEIAKRIANRLDGSGGGRPELAQGGGVSIEKINDIEKDLKSYI